MKRKACANCGVSGAAPFKDETFRISHRGISTDVKGLSGRRCSACGDVVFTRASAGRYAAAGDELVTASRVAERSEIRRIRKKLGLSQAKAASLMGGGHNAFSRYERGEISPMPAVMNLLRLLDRHPELLNELIASQ